MSFASAELVTINQGQMPHKSGRTHPIHLPSIHHSRTKTNATTNNNNQTTNNPSIRHHNKIRMRMGVRGEAAQNCNKTGNRYFMIFPFCTNRKDTRNLLLLLPVHPYLDKTVHGLDILFYTRPDIYVQQNLSTSHDATPAHPHGKGVHPDKELPSPLLNFN